MTLHIPQIRSGSTPTTISPAKVSQGAIRKTFYRRFFKRALDIICVILSAPLALPILVFFAALITVTGGKPIYSQLRVGRNGAHFRIWKFRTMVHNADELLAHHLQQNPAARAEWHTTQKLKNDPRITRIGRVLRKTSMDELPQILNVLTGTMSIVGPRPMMVDQTSLYPGHTYYAMRPGITGLWQVSDRNNCSFAERAFYDDAYHGSMSLTADVKILIKTVGVVLRATGH